MEIIDKTKDVIKNGILWTKETGRKLTDRVINFSRGISESKVGNAIHNSQQKTNNTVITAGEKSKACGTTARIADKAAAIVAAIKEKIAAKKATFVAKHPKIAKILGKIAKVICIGAAGVLAVKVFITLLAIFPEVLSLVLTAMAMLIGVEVIAGIFQKAFNL